MAERIKRLSLEGRTALVTDAALMSAGTRRWNTIAV